MKFVLFVEGQTERKAIPPFLKRWLDPQLTQPVGIQAVEFDGWADLVEQAPFKAQVHLNSPKKDVVAVIALLDIFRLGLVYPKRIKSANQRCDWGQHLETKVGEAKFRQFFAVHEIEAWLLSDLTIFPAEVRGDLAGKVERPETVNDNGAPAELLRKLYWHKIKRTYKKPVDGVGLFDKLDPNVAYGKCPNLKSMLDEMLALAKEAGL